MQTNDLAKDKLPANVSLLSYKLAAKAFQK